ncbi:MAG: T9SS type A sorting domain-containing protein [Candidatus Latescibacteria bacterium]|nr:T9SS type A sorting domain-containing protein [Candidatus Latescibacterota bacterium]
MESHAKIGEYSFRLGTTNDEYIVDAVNPNLEEYYVFVYNRSDPSNCELSALNDSDLNLKRTTRISCNLIPELFVDTSTNNIIVMQRTNYTYLTAYDPQTFEVAAQNNLATNERFFTFDGEGKAYSISSDGGISVFDAATLEKTDSITFQGINVSSAQSLSLNTITHEIILRYHDRLVIIDTLTNMIKQILLVQFNISSSVAPVFNTVLNEYYLFDDATTSMYVFTDPDNPGGTSVPVAGKITATASNSIEIGWLPVDGENIKGYKVYRSPHDVEEWTQLNNRLLTGTSYNDDSAIPNIPYDYQVKTVGAFNVVSEPSETVTATLGSVPDFSLIPMNSYVSTEPEHKVDFIITAERRGGLNEPVSLEIEGLPESVLVTYSSNPLLPGEVCKLSMVPLSNETVMEYEFLLIGRAQGLVKQVPLTLNITDTAMIPTTITLSVSDETIYFGDSVNITGRIRPFTAGTVNIMIYHGETVEKIQTESSKYGYTGMLAFTPDDDGAWKIQATWGGNSEFSGASSELHQLTVQSPRTRITCTTDVCADADIGWQMTVKGAVFPNPGVGDVTLSVTKPNGAAETIEGLKINELGYYGYNITLDQPGRWKVRANWAGNSRYIGSVSPPLVVPFKQQIGRALLASFTKDTTADYPTANRLGKLAYSTLTNRRFDNDRIKYLDVDTGQDLNGDGFTGDVDGMPTLSFFEETVTEWAPTVVNTDVQFSMYLVGGGTEEGIETSDGNILRPARLNDLVTDMEAKSGCDDVVMVIDAPHGGQFTRALGKAGRCIVSSVDKGEPEKAGDGRLSFSQYFLNYMNEGQSVSNAFLGAAFVQSKLPGRFGAQKPLLEADGDGVPNEPEDYEIASDRFLGSAFNLQDMMPRMKSMSMSSVAEQGGGVGKVVTNIHSVRESDAAPSLILSKIAAARGVDLWVRVDDAERNISNVYATVFGPDDSVLTEVELFDTDGDGKYDGTLYGLDDTGAYDIVAYAFDASENVSEPMKSLVVVVEREVVLEPPTDVQVSDVPNDNGYHLQVSWTPSTSEETGDVGWYRIYRSRSADLTDPLPLSGFTSIDSLNACEAHYTILVDSVMVGETAYIDTVPLCSVEYYYWLQAAGPTGTSKLSASGRPVAVRNRPGEFVVHPPSPNPFNPRTTIRYDLPEDMDVEFVIYDILGRKVRVLEEGRQGAGTHEVVWNGIDGKGYDVASGVYFYSITAGRNMRRGKMVMVR